MTGIIPRINGASFGVYKAHLLEYEIGPCSYENGYIVTAASMIPIKIKYSLGVRSIELTIDFEGETMHEIEQNISEFTELLHESAEVLLNDGFTYACYFQNSSTPIQKAPWILQVKFTLEGYRHGPLETRTLKKSGSVFVDGNYKTPAVLKISTSAASVKVFGITIGNISGEIVIDSYKKTVTETVNGVTSNKFADTDMTEFPKLKAGYNEIDIEADGDIAVELRYYPIYR